MLTLLRAVVNMHGLQTLAGHSGKVILRVATARADCLAAAVRQHAKDCAATTDKTVRQDGAQDGGPAHRAELLDCFGRLCAASRGC